jgi:hypothetical protein
MEQQTRHIRVEVDLEAVTDDAYRFVATRWPRAEPRQELGDLGSGRNRFVPIEILEQMVLSGVTQRKDVAEFIASCFNPQHFDVR